MGDIQTAKAALADAGYALIVALDALETAADGPDAARAGEAVDAATEAWHKAEIAVGEVTLAPPEGA